MLLAAAAAATAAHMSSCWCIERQRKAGCAECSSASQIVLQNGHSQPASQSPHHQCTGRCCVLCAAVLLTTLHSAQLNSTIVRAAQCRLLCHHHKCFPSSRLSSLLVCGIPALLCISCTALVYRLLHGFTAPVQRCRHEHAVIPSRLTSQHSLRCLPAFTKLRDGGSLILRRVDSALIAPACSGVSHTQHLCRAYPTYPCPTLLDCHSTVPPPCPPCL